MKRIQGGRSVLGLLAGVLLLVLIGSYQAQAVWTKSETSRIKKLENQISTLEQRLQEVITSQQLVTVRYLATGGSGGTYKDICPGSENLEGEPQGSSYIGRLAPKTDGLGNIVTDINGNPRQAYVYTCRIQFFAKK